MSISKRSTQVNLHGYQEVLLDYRIYRATQLASNQEESEGKRIVCPMIDAARSKRAYGQQSLPGLKSADLEKWSNALDLSIGLVKGIAYFSGNFFSFPKNFITGSFDDQAINGGFVHFMKRGINTNILKENSFNQDGLNAFAWSCHPSLEGIAMTNEWLYTSAADEIYFDNTHLTQIVEYNKSNSRFKWLGLGGELSALEMNDLLLNVLGQKIINHPTVKQAILVRDIHDLYKYGLMPAHIEEKLARAELLNLS